MKSCYAKSGVDIKKVKKSHRDIFSVIRKTLSFRKPGIGAPIDLIGHYGGLVDLGEKTLVLHTDGVGTKVLVAEALGDYSTIGIDAVAMTVNDLICLGAEPVSIMDYIALKSPDKAIVRAAMSGILEGCRQSNCAISGGETAIVPDLMKSRIDMITMGAALVDKGKIITGSKIKAGDSIVGLSSSGIHSNGLTLARKILPKGKWKELLVPTRIYVKPTLEMVKTCEVHGLAHITGGAFSKLTRILPKGTGALLDSMPEPKQPVFAEIQRRGKVSDREMYRTFNMGIGFVVVTPDPEGVLKVAKKWKVGAQEIGHVTKRSGKVEITVNGKTISVS